jgi:hypothetical protein
MTTLDLMNALVVAGIDYRLDYGQETSGQAGGQVRVRDLRSPLWMMDVDCSTLTLQQLRIVRARVAALGGSRGSFYAYDPATAYPEADPDGAIVGSSAVLINSLGADGSSLSLKGLPAGYALTEGDLLAFTFSSTRRALHMIDAVAGAVANGSGVTPEFHVSPPIRQGAAVNNPVNLKMPAAEMRIVPGSLSQNASGMIGTYSFKAVQVA